MSDNSSASVAFDPAIEAVDPMRQTAAAPAGDGDDLIAAMRGDEAAFTRLFRRHSDAVYRYAWLLTGSESTADDVMQETFIRMLDATGFDPARGSLAAFLCGIARHVAMRAVDRRLAYVDDIEQHAEQRPDADAPVLPQDALERRRAMTQLYAAIRRLPPAFRDVLILVELHEMSYGEAAAVAGVELGTVRSRLARAKARLAQALKEMIR